MEQLIQFLNKGVTQFHVVEQCRAYLQKHGFQTLDMGKAWDVIPEGKYYVQPFSSELIAFTVGASVDNLRIATAHTDFPMLKIKSNPDMHKSGYHMVNVEPYGGLVMESWFDRPLGMAGKVVIKTEDAFSPEVCLYDSEYPLFVIPCLAPHLKKDDKNAKLDPQKELIPLLDVEGTNVSGSRVLNLVADKLECAVQDILDYDLYLYNMDQAELIGANKTLISSPRIDDLSSVSAAVEGLVLAAEGKENGSLMLEEEKGSKNLNVIALFDNEEIGSRSKQGADSTILQSILMKIFESLQLSEEDRYALMQHAFLASLDVAHATHPNYSDKSDPTNEVILGKGVVLKSSASQRYVTDSEASAVILALGKQHNIDVQRQVNRSGMAGGQTLGPITSSYLPVLAVDMGMPVLAMHSARELAHINDYEALKKMLNVLFV